MKERERLLSLLGTFEKYMHYVSNYFFNNDKISKLVSHLSAIIFTSSSFLLCFAAMQIQFGGRCFVLFGCEGKTRK